MCDYDAEWIKMSSGNKIFYCDKHVPRGCTCNQRPISEIDNLNHQGTDKMYWSEKDDLLQDGKYERMEDTVLFEDLDIDGRRFPCQEFEYLGSYGYQYKDNVYGFSKKYLQTAILANKYFPYLPDSFKNKINSIVESIQEEIYEDRMEEGKFKEGIDYTKVIPLFQEAIRFYSRNLLRNPILSATVSMEFNYYVRKFYFTLKSVLRGGRHLLQDNSCV